ncbi:hypothetical protein SAMN05421505_102285 [Sinosporangium album]|uniref:CopC domain-containing protein n=1 Tax=Sinosporangium album TaxID=504805 RepID=A0A1G7SF21_9ACTN|nr:copper resistance CopC family protein [Sinosporangium album]SDG21667.1 hypothetical protein SAMN05421505_102285 [Sinosporangium album]
MKTSPRAFAAALLAAFLLVAALAQPALAHDRLKSSDPAKDSVVSGVEKVTLEFTATTSHQVVIVRAADGTAYQQGKPKADGDTVVQGLNGALPPGDYTIAFRVVSSDGHPIEGEIPFKVKGEPGPAAAAPEAAATPQASESAVAAPAPETPAASVAPSPAAADGDTGGIPAWSWIVVGGLAGIGIGLLFSMRNKKK